MSVSFLFKPMIFSLLFEVIADNNRITAFVIDGFVGIDQGPVLLLINFPLVGFHRFLFRSDRFNEKLGRDGNRQVLIVDIPTAEIFGRIHLQDIVVYLSGEIISLIGRFIINEIVRFIFKGIASYYIASVSSNLMEPNSLKRLVFSYSSIVVQVVYGPRSK